MRMPFNKRLINLSNIELPIIQAEMAGSAFSNMVVAVSARRRSSSAASREIRARRID
jgi:hypothetical protein